jgi:signal transduction histidine kinase
MVLDQEKLIDSSRVPEEKSYEKVNPVTYRFYRALPYQNTIHSVGDQEDFYSEFWTVCACEINLLEQCSSTMIFVWLSCFVAFFVAAWILSAKTYQIYQKREAFERYRSETTNALAHELKTPLSIISGYAQNLMEQVHTEKRDYYAANINENVNRMDKIIREMLDLSRLESGSFQIRYEEVSIGEVAERLLERYHEVCCEKTITASLEGDASIKADPSLLERVMDNFFINAVEHTPAGGKIHIKINDHTLEVFNSGSQIPEDVMGEIWQPYQKGENATGQTKGTGLGLSISREILGRFQFQYGAKNVDAGVVFWVRW